MKAIFLPVIAAIAVLFLFVDSSSSHDPNHKPNGANSYYFYEEADQRNFITTLKSYSIPHEIDDQGRVFYETKHEPLFRRALAEYLEERSRRISFSKSDMTKRFREITNENGFFLREEVYRGEVNFFWSKEDDKEIRKLIDAFLGRK